MDLFREDIKELRKDVKEIRTEDIPEIREMLASLKTRVSIFSGLSGAAAAILTVLAAILVKSF